MTSPELVQQVATHADPKGAAARAELTRRLTDALVHSSSTLERLTGGSLGSPSRSSLSGWRRSWWRSCG